MFLVAFALKPKSTLSSPQLVMKESAENTGAFLGFLVMIF